MIMELKFDSSKPGDDDDFKLAMHGTDFYLVLWDLDQFLRNEIKYQNKNEYQPIRDKLHELMQERNVTLDMVA